MRSRPTCPWRGAGPGSSCWPPGARWRVACLRWSSATAAGSARWPALSTVGGPGSRLRSISRSPPDPESGRIAASEPPPRPPRGHRRHPRAPPAGLPAVTDLPLRVLQIVDAAAFLLIGVLALRDWWRGREGRRGYLAIALGSLGLVALGAWIEPLVGQPATFARVPVAARPGVAPTPGQKLALDLLLVVWCLAVA